MRSRICLSLCCCSKKAPHEKEIAFSFLASVSIQDRIKSLNETVSNNKMKITMTKNRALPMIAALLLLAIATQSYQLTRRALQEADCNDICSYNIPYCSTYNAECQCVQCSDRRCLNSDTNSCSEAVSDQCKNYACGENGEGYCTECYDGWELSDGQCVQPPEDNGCDAGPCTMNDPYCNTFNFVSCQCDVCSYRTCMNSQTNLCQPVSDQCREWACGENGGYCTCCYWGYKLVNGQCVRA